MRGRARHRTNVIFLCMSAFPKMEKLHTRSALDIWYMRGSKNYCIFIRFFVDLIKVPFALLIFFMDLTLHILEKWGEEGMNEYL